MTSIDEALAAAQENVVEEKTETHAVAKVEKPTVDVASMSLEQLGGGPGLNVDAFLRVDKGGFSTNKHSPKENIESFVAKVNLEQMQEGMHLFLRVSSGGGGANIYKSYDGKVEAKTNEPWDKFVQLAKSRGDRPPFLTTDVVFELMEDALNSRTKEVMMKKGDKLGYTPPSSGAKELSTLVTAIKKQGKTEAVLKVTYDIINYKSFSWALPKYEIIG